jgi:hypothetical protein
VFQVVEDMVPPHQMNYCTKSLQINLASTLLQ